MSEKIIVLSDLIDGPIEDTINLLSTLSLNEIISFEDQIKLKYSEVELVKDMLLQFIQLDQAPIEDVEKANSNLGELYKALQRIEDILNVILSYKDAITKSTLKH